jgi:hydroxyacylglutathione hydrolase
MTIEPLTVGPIGTNSYLVCDDSGAAFLVDAADEAARLLEAVQARGAHLEAIFQTHGHPDHLAALREVAEATGAPIFFHEAEARHLDATAEQMSAMFGPIPWPIAHRTYAEGEVLSVGALSVQVLHTPGHTPGSVCLQVEDALFTGDTLFAGGIGRYDFPGGDWDELSRSLIRLASLPEGLQIYPGHGPGSTIGDERQSNEWLQDLL